MSETKPVSTDFWIGMLSPLLFVIFFIPLILLKAWVLTWLWHWYVVPMFGVPPLRMVFAFGLSLTANYLLPHPESAKDHASTALVTKMIIGPFVALGLGWIGSWFI